MTSVRTVAIPYTVAVHLTRDLVLVGADVGLQVIDGVTNSVISTAPANPSWVSPPGSPVVSYTTGRDHGAAPRGPDAGRDDRRALCIAGSWCGKRIRSTAAAVAAMKITTAATTSACW